MPFDRENFVQHTKKLALCLQNADKRARKNALIELEKLLRIPYELSNGELSEIFVETHMYTLNGLRDNAETVREQAIIFLTFFIVDRLPLNDFYLTYVSPVLVERLGTPELIEESEEIRLQLLKFQRAIISKYSNTEQLKPFLGDFVMILCETVKDKHPAVKELSCECVVMLAEALPRDFHLQAENLVKPLVTCVGHQRYKVRVKAIEAIGEVVMHSTYKGLEDAVGPLAEKLFDQIPAVRRTVAKVTARWLLEYRDRYSFFHKLLPLLLTGLNDEVEETRQEADQLWEKVGLQYMSENETDLKDQMDFLLEPPKYYLEHLKRPNLGCRVLVQRNVIKLCKALSFELTSWQADIRVRCSQLLCSLALHAEAGLTQNLLELLPAMYSAARDDDQRVRDNIKRASEIMGSFIPVDTWYKLVLPAMEEGFNFGHLIVLRGFIEGAPTEYITSRLEQVAVLLSDDDACFTRKKQVQRELIKCVEAICQKYTTKSGTEIPFHLFKIMVATISLRDPENQHIDVKMLDSLSESLGFLDVTQLWSSNLGRLLEHIYVDPKSWMVVTPRRCVFETVLLESNAAFGENLLNIAAILIEALDPEADAEARLKTFWALSTAFEQKHVVFSRGNTDLTCFFDNLIRKVFVPSLVWHPGRTAEAMRTMAVSCFLRALSPTEGVELFTDSANLRELYNEMGPLLGSLMEDASWKSRQLAMECASALKEYACKRGVWGCEDLIRIYPEILKRLDDPTESVRECALGVLTEILANVPEEFKEPHFKAHHEFIIDTLMTHFDDDDENVKKLVFDALKVTATVNANEVYSKVDRLLPLLRNQKGCKEVLTYLRDMKLQ